MHRSRLVICLLTLLLVGCTTIIRGERFDRTLRAYSNAVRWSDFQTALYFVEARQIQENPPDMEELRRVRVISYNVKNLEHLKTNEQVRQTVHISYYKTDDMRQRNLVNLQIWEYDEEKKSWYLVSGLPDF